jgi:hypothetical protein
MMSLPCLVILEKTRPSIILAAIVLRQPTVLAKPQWKVDPWLMHPERIDSMKLLLDILADCPELYVARDQILKDPYHAENQLAAHSLIGKCHRVLEDLEEWEKSWLTDVAHACVEVPSLSTAPFYVNSSGVRTFVWSTVYQYDSLSTANDTTMFNAALILVLQLIRGLEDVVGNIHHREDLQRRMFVAGICICRSVDYHHGEDWGEQGGFFLLFPLRMAHDAVGKMDPTIGAWLKGVLDELAAGRRGLWKSARTLLTL